MNTLLAVRQLLLTGICEIAIIVNTVVVRGGWINILSPYIHCCCGFVINNVLYYFWINTGAQESVVTPLLLLLPSPPWLGMVVPVRMWSMGQIDLFEIFLTGLIDQLLKHEYCNCVWDFDQFKMIVKIDFYNLYNKRPYLLNNKTNNQVCNLKTLPK